MKRAGFRIILASECSKFQESKGRDRIASREECNRLLEACQNSRNEYLALIVLLAITTGMRQGEILGLTWDCIDFDRETITLKETKNGRPRTVSLVGQPLQLLRDQYLKRSLHPHFVFPAKKRFGQISIRKAWDEALKRAGIQELHFHDLRHTFATYAAEAGHPSLNWHRHGASNPSNASALYSHEFNNNLSAFFRRSSKTL